MSDLLDPDPEFGNLSADELRSVVSRRRDSVLRRGRALMELGRRARTPAQLSEVAAMIRAPEHRQLRAAGNTSVSQLGAAGLVAGGTQGARALAAELAREWDPGEQSDFAWLMKSSGMTWT